MQLNILCTNAVKLYSAENSNSALTCCYVSEFVEAENSLSSVDFLLRKASSFVLLKDHLKRVLLHTTSCRANSVQSRLMFIVSVDCEF